MKQFLTGDESEDRIPEELELLVIPDPAALECSLHFARLRGVSESLFQQFRSNETVTQHSLQLGNFLCLHA